MPIKRIRHAHFEEQFLTFMRRNRDRIEPVSDAFRAMTNLIRDERILQWGKENADDALKLVAASIETFQGFEQKGSNLSKDESRVLRDDYVRPLIQDVKNMFEALKHAEEEKILPAENVIRLDKLVEHQHALAVAKAELEDLEKAMTTYIDKGRRGTSRGR